MKLRIILAILIILILCSTFEVLAGPFGQIKPPIRIEEVNITDDIIVPNEPFEINVIIAKQRFRRFNGEIKVFLTNTGIIRETICKAPVLISIGIKDTYSAPIICTITDIETEWYQETYGIQVVLYEKIGLSLFGNPLWKKDTYTIESIRVSSKYWEKEKVTLKIKDVPQNLIGDDKSFEVNVTVNNTGIFDYNAIVRIDMVEKPSAIPQLEQLNLIEGLGTIRKELGIINKPIDAGSSSGELVISCTLRESEQKMTYFNIQAILFVDIDGVKYQVDSSTFYEIYHKQPLLREDNIPLILGIIFGILITVGVFFFFIRIIYPLYYIKRNTIRKDYNTMKRRKKR